MGLNKAQQKFLRGKSHDLQPVVMVADRGLTDNVMAEIDQALDHHELIKIKLRAEREQRDAWIEEIIGRTGAAPVHHIGQVLCLYRRNAERPVIELPHG